MNVLKNTSASLALLLAIASSGCSTMQTSHVPGVPEDTVPVDNRDISTIAVLLAIKAQIAQALIEIDALRQQHPNNPVAKDLKFKAGKGIFSGQTEIVKSDKGEMSLIIPFSGFDGTQGTPKASATRETTATQNITFAFNIDPKVPNGHVAPPAEGGQFIKESLVAAFSDMVRMADTPTSPAITPTSLQFVTSFGVVRKNDGGLTLKIVPTAPRLKEGGPGYTVSSSGKGTYKLDLTLPFAEASPADTRRIVYTITGANGQLLSVEEPYTQERYDALKAGLGQQQSGFRISSQPRLYSFPLPGAVPVLPNSESNIVIDTPQMAPEPPPPDF